MATVMNQLVSPLLLSLLVLPVWAEEAHESGPQAEALAWLTYYRQAQLLFHPADLDALQARLAGMTEHEAAAWLEETSRLRSRLDSPSWQQTRDWYLQYLEAQTDRGAKQLDRLRDRSVHLKASELERVVEKISAFRVSLLQRRLAAQETLRLQRADRQNSGISSTGVYQAPPIVIPVVPTVIEPQRCVYPPLIDSRDVARRVLWHALWGRRGKRIDHHALRASATK